VNDNDYEYGRCVIAAVFESDEIGVYENFTKCKVGCICLQTGFCACSTNRREAV